MTDAMTRPSLTPGSVVTTLGDSPRTGLIRGAIVDVLIALIAVEEMTAR